MILIPLPRAPRAAAVKPALLFALLAPSGLAAQAGDGSLDAEAVKAYLVDGFERARATDVAFAGAIPDSAFRWAPVTGVRDFAEQVAHAADNSFVGPAVFGEQTPSFFPDAALEDAAALAGAVEAAYDWILERLRATPAADLQPSAPFFGGREMPKWRILAFALEHAMWTRGQVVPYFRIHGIDPPDVRLF